MTMKHFARTAVLFAATFTTFAASKVPPKVAPDVPQSSPWTWIDVIVQFNWPSTNLQQFGSFGQIQKSFSVINAIHMTLPEAAIPFLAISPLVSYISPVRKTKGAVDISTGSVDTPLVWNYGYNGSGVGVAVIDSGVTLKNDLKGANGISRVVYSQDYVGGDGSDAYGHGTHVAGIIGANGTNSTGSAFTRTFKGMAPNVNIINFRVLDQNGSGNESDVISAIQQAIALKNTYNIRVINLSLGRQVYESYTLDPLCQAVEAAWKAGIVVVVAAGNSGRDNSMGTKGYGTIAAPGNDPYVITVGAVNAHGTVSIADDSIASYSSKGPTLIDHIAKPDLVAPGNGVISLLASPTCTLATTFPKTLVKNGLYETSGNTNAYSSDYFKLSGTSMATPVVSGAAALLIQQNPGLTPDQIKARLMKTARKILPTYMSGIDSLTNVTFMNQADIFTVGAGYLDVFNALQNNDLVTMPALSPTVVRDSVTLKTMLVRNLSVIWGDGVIWGDSVIWGTNIFNGVVNGKSVIWGDSVVWGDSTTSGFSVIWGDAVNAAGTLLPFDVDDGDVS
jgi:serine protease AprX